MLIVHNSIPGNSFAEVVAWIRANPGRFNFASAGVGAITHLIMEDVGARLNLDMVHVPYRQTTNAMTDLLAGRVHARCPPSAATSTPTPSSASRRCAPPRWWPAAARLGHRGDGGRRPARRGRHACAAAAGPGRDRAARRHGRAGADGGHGLPTLDHRGQDACLRA
jgi:hypothetical protein